MSPAELPPVTDTRGVLHATICYPFARTVGCSCGWVRRDVDEAVMDDLCTIHLADKGVTPPW